MTKHTHEATRPSNWKNRLAFLIIVPAVLLVPSAADQDVATPFEPVRTTVDPEVLAEETAAVATARETYAEAGLAFPDTAINFHGDPAPCRGHDGYYLLRHDGTATIDICYPQDDPDIRHISRARTLWHELAHAYVEPRVDDATKTAVLDLLGLTDWDEGTWSDLGKENAAEILVWGIADGRYRPREVTEFDCATKAVAYELLTGLAGPEC